MNRKILPVFCWLFFAINIIFSSLSLAEEDSQVINLETSNLEYYLGDTPKGGIIRKTVRIRNGLNEALKISDVKSTCDCIGAKVQPQTVEKGVIFQIEVVLDSTGLSGDVEEVLYILTQNLKYELIRLVVSAAIAEPQ